jgi:hypothetical protein
MTKKRIGIVMILLVFALLPMAITSRIISSYWALQKA